MMTYNIVIVDDQLLLAKALSKMVDDFRHFNVIYEVANGAALQEHFNNKKNIPDIVLLDVYMPVMNGFETARWLKENHPEILIMALSVQDDDESLLKMVECGAKSYEHKNVSPQQLEYALTELVKKGKYFPEWANNRFYQRLAMPPKSPQPGSALSEREKLFLSNICSELTYREIAEKMICSPRTVESYRDSLFQKLGVNTRTALVIYAIKNGFCGS